MPSQLEGHEVAMNRIKALAEEHFDDYVFIVGKDKNIWHMYKNSTSAFGMMAKVSQDIYQSWVCGKR